MTFSDAIVRLLGVALIYYRWCIGANLMHVMQVDGAITLVPMADRILKLVYMYMYRYLYMVDDALMLV